MIFTRDSFIWTATLFAAAGTFLLGHFDLLTRAFPSITGVWQARIEVAAAFAGFIAGWLKMSPLRLHPRSELAGTADPSKMINPLNPPGKE